MAINWSQWGNTALQAGFNMMGANQQHKRQKELMGIQHGNQQELNKQGHQLQMDMWNKTNYEAQLKHMKKAGLNPALMYGMGGGGGTTAGSQGGGSAAGGNAVQMHPIDIANLALVKAQRDNIEADTKNKEADTGLKGSQKELAISNAELNNIKRDLDKQSYKYLDERDMSRESFGAVKALKEMTGANYNRVFKALDDRIGDMLDVYDDPGKAIKDKANKVKEVLDEAILGHGILYNNIIDGIKKGLDNWRNRK